MRILIPAVDSADAGERVGSRTRRRSVPASDDEPSEDSASNRAAERRAARDEGGEADDQRRQSEYAFEGGHTPAVSGSSVRSFRIHLNRSVVAVSTNSPRVVLVRQNDRKHPLKMVRARAETSCARLVAGSKTLHASVSAVGVERHHTCTARSVLSVRPSAGAAYRCSPPPSDFTGFQSAETTRPRRKRTLISVGRTR